MSVSPRPKFTTLHVMRSGFDGTTPSLKELGRLHFTTGELNSLEKLERQRIRQMAFSIVKKTTLPVTTLGRTATEPRISVGENGRFVFNAIISKEWEEKKVTKVALLFDADSNKVACMGFAADAKGVKDLKAEDYFPVQKASKGDQYSLGASGFLREVAKYDFAAAGSQNFPAAIDPKYGFVLELPKVTPARRPTAVRKPKSTAPATVAAVATVEAPTEDEISMD